MCSVNVLKFWNALGLPVASIARIDTSITAINRKGTVLNAVDIKAGHLELELGLSIDQMR
jgi:hypothetical protein